MHELVRRTEGWPAGLYLGALASRAGGAPTGIGVTFTGDDRYMGDYLRSEFLDRVSPADVSFLTRTSILERMCGPLCDATLGVTRSSEVLEQLERRNLLVVPLDRRREWYRYHHLFRELLLSELRRREPEMVDELHLRAAEWYEGNGMPEAAIDHAQAAGDDDRVASLVLQVASPVWASGRCDTVLRWMEWFEANDLIERHPAIAVHGALMFALVGKPGGDRALGGRGGADVRHGTLADGNTMEATSAYLRALLCRDGPEEMRRDAQISLQGLSPASPYRSTMLHVEGLSHLLAGDPDAADAIFARAVDTAERGGSAAVRPRSARLPAASRRSSAATGPRPNRSPSRPWRSWRAVSSTTTGRAPSCSPWRHASRLQRGDLEQGRQLVTRAARLRPLLNYALPVVSVQALLEMARSYIALADPGGARAVLRQAGDIFQQRPDLGTLPDIADELRTKVDTVRARSAGASSLTTAELRLLPLLPTHLSFREIGERLFVSRHTVKTQAISIYRKLGATSRSETIERMHELGLLDRI